MLYGRRFLQVTRTGDGGAKATGTATNPDADANSTLCDASQGVEIETSVSFPLGLGYGCDPISGEDLHPHLRLEFPWQCSRQRPTSSRYSTCDPDGRTTLPLVRRSARFRSS